MLTVNKSYKDKKYIKILLYVFIFIIAFCARLYFISEKNSTFIDTALNYVITTPNNVAFNGKKIKYSWYDLDFDINKEYTAYEVKSILFKMEPSVSGIIKDIITMYKKPIDYNHTNLYYTIFRIWNIGIDSFDIKQIINRGCTLNLIFFTLSFFFMYKLLNLIRKDDVKFISLGLFFGFFSTGAVSNSLLIREYALMETLFIINCYIFIYLYIYFFKENNDLVLKNSKIILFSFGSSLFLLSGYFAIIMYFLMFFVLTLKILKNKQKENLKLIFTMFLLTVILTFSLDINYLHIENSEHSILKNILFAITYYKNDLHSLFMYITNFIFYNNYIIILLCIFILTHFVYKIPRSLNKNDLKLPILLILLASIWIFVVWICTPYKTAFPDTLRFIVSAFPILSLVYVLFIYKIKEMFCILLLFLYIQPFFCTNHGLTYFNYADSNLDFFSRVSEKPFVCYIDKSSDVQTRAINSALLIHKIMYLNKKNKIIFIIDKKSPVYKSKKYIHLN